MASQIDKMNEESVMDHLASRKTLPLFLEHVCKHAEWYDEVTLSAAARFLQGICASEIFSTERTRYIETKEQKTLLVTATDLFVRPLIAKNILKRPEVQTLLDEAARYERAVGKATVTPLSDIPARTTNES